MLRTAVPVACLTLLVAWSDPFGRSAAEAGVLDCHAYPVGDQHGPWWLYRHCAVVRLRGMVRYMGLACGPGMAVALVALWRGSYGWALAFWLVPTVWVLFRCAGPIGDHVWAWHLGYWL